MRSLFLGIACAVALAASHPSNAAGQSGAPGATGQDERLVGTVSAIHADSRTFDLVTGVGYALRVCHVRLAAPGELTARGTAADLRMFARGAVVSVEGRWTTAGFVASKCEVMRPAKPERRP